MGRPARNSEGAVSRGGSSRAPARGCSSEGPTAVCARQVTQTNRVVPLCFGIDINQAITPTASIVLEGLKFMAVSVAHGSLEESAICAASDGIPPIRRNQNQHRDSPRDGSANSYIDGRSPGSRVAA